MVYLTIDRTGLSTGDTDNGKGYMAFGTYGHKTVTTSDDGQSEVVYDATADWKGYKYFQCLTKEKQ